MKKFLPFVFPLIALLIVFFLAYRWYSMRTERTGEISSFGEGIQIEDLTTTDQKNILKGTGDYKKVTLQGTGEATGEVRYELKDGKIRFSVMANLPSLTQGEYQVWLKQVNGEAVKKAFVLADTKGGFTGSASLDETALPFEIVVSKELRPDDSVEEVVLRAIVTKENK